MTTKKAEKKADPTSQNSSKTVKAPAKDTQMRNAFIRLSIGNTPEKDKNDSVSWTVEKIKDVLDWWAFECGLTYWFIKHNPDEDDSNPHFHIVIRFRTNSRFSTIQGKFPGCHIEPIKSTIKKSVQYLVHLNDPSKRAYEWEDVITNGGDLSAFKVQSRDQQAVALQRVFDLIESGEITKHNVEKKVPVALFSYNRNIIENALDHHRMCMFGGANRDIRVVFFEGVHGGEGKSEFVKGFCEHQNLTYFASSGSRDPLQDYNDEDVLILDDVRDSVFKFHDLIKMLDNYTQSAIGSRYHNKLFTGQVIAITSNQPLLEWYPGIDDDKHPLYRRITDLYRFNQGRIFHYTYNRHTLRYEPRGSSTVPDWCIHAGSEQKTLDMLDILGIDKVPDSVIKAPPLYNAQPGRPILAAPRNSASIVNPEYEIIQYNGKHRTATKSITQIKIEETQPTA